MDIDIDQTKRIGRLEDRLNRVENELSAISGKLQIIEKLCRGLIVLAGLALGMDATAIVGGM